MSIRGITFVNQIVKSDDDASLHNMLLSGRSGVMKGCSTTFDSSHIYVTSGQFVILGRQIEVQGTETITPEAVAEGKKYCRLVFEIDLSKINTTETFGQGYFKVLSSSVSYPGVTQEDLTAGGTVYQYPWARFTQTVNGIANFANDTTVLQFSVDDVLSALSENPVQNRVVYEKFKKITDGTQQVGDSEKLGGKEAKLYALLTDLKNYLGINATAADSNKLGGQAPSYYAAAAALLGYLGKGSVRLGDITFDNNANALIIHIDGNPYSIPFSVDACPPGNFKGIATVAAGVQSHVHDSVDCTNMTIPQLKALLKTWADSDAVNISDFNIYTTRVSDNFINLWNSGDTTSAIGWGGWWYWVKIGADTTTYGFQKFLVCGYLGTEIYYVEYRMGSGWSNLRPLLHSDNIGNYALPLSGGAIGNGTIDSPVAVKGKNNSLIEFYNASSFLGRLGFNSYKSLVYYDENWAGYPLHHDGNSAKVAIQSTAPADGLWVW